MKKANTSMTIRTDSEVKKQASRIFESLGIDMTTAVNVFLRQVIRTNGIPFELKADEPNELTYEAIEQSVSDNELYGPFDNTSASV